jgi:drug/metabolite transporter (DMT)-like permease
MPLFGAVLAISFLGEQLAGYHAAGAALVLAGVVMTSRKAGAPAVSPSRTSSPAPTAALRGQP